MENEQTVRLQKFLAECGVASRRKAEELIVNGEVSVNGKVVTELGVKVDPKKDTVVYNGEELRLSARLVYIMLHKPEGYVTTVKDQFDRPTVLDLIEESAGTRLVPVGRLDYNTSGLLLLTNDGEMVHKLTHPKHNIEKTYVVKVKGIPTDVELDKLRKGVVIDGYKTAPAFAAVTKRNENTAMIKIGIKEGKNRQIRKMCEAIDHEVIHLKRVSTGKLSLGELKKGEYRFLTKEEVRYLKSI